MQIKLATESDAPTWDAYVHRHPCSNPYLLSAWSDAINSAYGHKVYRLMAVDGDEVVGLLPLVHINPPIFGNTLFSMPYADLGGVIANDEQTSSALIDYATQIAADNNIPTIELRQDSELNRATSSCQQSAANNDKVRMLLDLPATADALMAGFKAKLRSQIRRPQKDGIQVKSGGIELLDPFYTVFAENMRDLGSPVHAKKFIACVVNNFNDKACIFIIHKNDEVYAVSITLGCSSTLYNPWASSLRRFSTSSPNMLLYWAMLEHACNNDYAAFDFGRSTPGEGTYKFKKQWGAIEQPLKWFSWKNKINTSKEKQIKLPSMDLRTRVASCWSKLPVPVSKLIGPPLRKYIGL